MTSSLNIREDSCLRTGQGQKRKKGGGKKFPPKMLPEIPSAKFYISGA